jgi:hypothetical protein
VIVLRKFTTMTRWTRLGPYGVVGRFFHDGRESTVQRGEESGNPALVLGLGLGVPPECGPVAKAAMEMQRASWLVVQRCSHHPRRPRESSHASARTDARPDFRALAGRSDANIDHNSRCGSSARERRVTPRRSPALYAGRAGSSRTDGPAPGRPLHGAPQASSGAAIARNSNHCKNSNIQAVHQ